MRASFRQRCCWCYYGYLSCCWLLPSTCTCACVQCTCTRYLSLPTRYPWHASCKLQWTFTSLSCSQVQLSSNKKTKLMKSSQVGEKLERQMSAWEGDSNCGVTSSSCPELPCGQVMLRTHHQHRHQQHHHDHQLFSSVCTPWWTPPPPPSQPSTAPQWQGGWR